MQEKLKKVILLILLAVNVGVIVQFSSRSDQLDTNVKTSDTIPVGSGIMPKKFANGPKVNYYKTEREFPSNGANKTKVFVTLNQQWAAYNLQKNNISQKQMDAGKILCFVITHPDNLG